MSPRQWTGERYRSWWQKEGKSIRTWEFFPGKRQREGEAFPVLSQWVCPVGPRGASHLGSPTASAKQAEVPVAGPPACMHCWTWLQSPRDSRPRLGGGTFRSLELSHPWLLWVEAPGNRNPSSFAEIPAQLQGPLPPRPRLWSLTTSQEL